MVKPIYQKLSSSDWPGRVVHLHAARRHREWASGVWWSTLQPGVSAVALQPSMNLLQLALNPRSFKVGCKCLSSAAVPPMTHGCERDKRMQGPVSNHFPMPILALLVFA